MIAALRATFLLVQCEDEEHQLLPGRQLVPAKVNVSCPRSMSLRLEHVTRELPDLDGEPVDQLIPVAALGELGDLTADDIIHGDSADHVSDVDAPERLLEAWLQDGPVMRRDLFKSAKESGFTPRTLQRAAKRLGVVRSSPKQEGVPRNKWPVFWSLPDMSGQD